MTGWPDWWGPPSSSLLHQPRLLCTTLRCSWWLCGPRSPQSTDGEIHASQPMGKSFALCLKFYSSSHQFTQYRMRRTIWKQRNNCNTNISTLKVSADNVVSLKKDLMPIYHCAKISTMPHLLMDYSWHVLYFCSCVWTLVKSYQPQKMRTWNSFNLCKLTFCWCFSRFFSNFNILSKNLQIY